MHHDFIIFEDECDCNQSQTSTQTQRETVEILWTGIFELDDNTTNLTKNEMEMIETFVKSLIDNLYNVEIINITNFTMQIITRNDTTLSKIKCAVQTISADSDAVAAYLGSQRFENALKDEFTNNEIEIDDILFKGRGSIQHTDKSKLKLTQNSSKHHLSIHETLMIGVSIVTTIVHVVI